ncbi:phosphate/phosphite/phosphonate ABC transporter substrate-binding protein [Thermodesulfobacterium sp. TA1]|uniref:phosphate/phosphite/phosphonate ABC transporter substrate-binding protein n=1 Tax=Thermodesulfobacterium sp. TA1 TaxID=2234087 RepID=UPI001231B41F|nr:phosphate/phosphite/phosphonate ABC transporter substrate-binding protein [Thermodesulfobacterium sp. TA1]QER41875.1 phosphate/phosphite/phosphonate ABC transporter substrate-binding protein [Thermodesulfobacterium sp. TA1]
MKGLLRALLLVLFVGLLWSLSLSYAAEKKCLVMGLIPAEEPKSMIERYRPMKEWMEKDMGMCIEMFTAVDYTGVIEAMRAKKVDFAWFGAFSYVLANERAGAEAFAVGIDEKGRTTYRSYLVATQEVAQLLGINRPLEGENGMKILREKLEKHKGKFSFAFTDPASTSGYAVPFYYMAKAGMDPKAYFRNVGFVGTHDAAELAVFKKTLNIVADNDITYDKLLREGKITKEKNIVIWMSPEIPGPPMAYRKDLPEKIKEALRKSITRVPRDVVVGYGKIVGYKLVSDADYETIKKIKKFIDTQKSK